VPKGQSPRRPTYRGCCEEILSAYERALAKGQPIVITEGMKQALVVMQHCLSIDTRVEKRKVYRRKQKRRKLRERKLLKQQPKPQPTETP
jgi:hypothetical protein